MPPPHDDEVPLLLLNLQTKKKLIKYAYYTSFLLSFQLPFHMGNPFPSKSRVKLAYSYVDMQWGIYQIHQDNIPSVVQWRCHHHMGWWYT